MGNTSEVVIKQNCKGLYFILAHLLQMPKLTRVTEWYSDFLMMFIFKTSRGVVTHFKIKLTVCDSFILPIDIPRSCQIKLERNLLI